MRAGHWARAAAARPEPTTDVTRAADGIDMPELVRYAADKGVGLLLWVHWEHLAPRMDEVLDTYARWGIKGVKVDFMDRDDQEMVEFYQRLAAATAKRHLLLDLHGAYVPAGLAAQLSQLHHPGRRAGRRMEQDGQARHAAAQPDAAVHAHARGPDGLHPGRLPPRNACVVRSAREDAADANHARPGAGDVRGLRQPLADGLRRSGAPTGGEAGFDFIRRVPTAWDETRFLAGEPGRDIVLARRSGANLVRRRDDRRRGAHRARAAALPARGRYRATMWQDGEAPDDVRRSERTMTARDVLALRLSPAGGAAVILEPAP